MTTVTPPKIGLVLSGGGARAAYQIGVLKAVYELIDTNTNPFTIICGTSAGAINASVLAHQACRYPHGLDYLERLWSRLHTKQIYRTDSYTLIRNAIRWLNALLQGNRKQVHLSLLDNRPLVRLLRRMIRFDQIEQNITDGLLQAFCITALDYGKGENISFFQGDNAIASWDRYRRRGIRTEIRLPHLLASTAIPLLFPAIAIGDTFYGDGNLRQLAPISPALHLGADRVFVIGADPGLQNLPRAEKQGYPSIAEIAGQILDNLFTDSLETDLERLTRINRTLQHTTPKQSQQTQTLQLRPIQSLAITPSISPSVIAPRYLNRLPYMLRFFFRRIGISKHAGATILSYLLFEAEYTKDLIALGYYDTLKKRDEVIAFFK